MVDDLLLGLEDEESDESDGVAEHLAEKREPISSTALETWEKPRAERTWVKVTVEPRMMTLPPTRRMSLMTPERVRTREEALPMRKTTAMLRRRAVEAFMMRMGAPTVSRTSEKGA